MLLAGWSSQDPDRTDDGPLWLDANRQGTVFLCGGDTPVVSVPVIDRTGARTFARTTPETVAYLFGHSGLQVKGDEAVGKLYDTLRALLGGAIAHASPAIAHA